MFMCMEMSGKSAYSDPKVAHNLLEARELLALAVHVVLVHLVGDEKQILLLAELHHRTLVSLVENLPRPTTLK